jgi:hypothetical protein
MYVQVKDVLVRCSFLRQWGKMFKEASSLIRLYIHMIIFLSLRFIYLSKIQQFNIQNAFTLTT